VGTKDSAAKAGAPCGAGRSGGPQTGPVHRSVSGSRSRLVGFGAREGHGCGAAGLVAQAGPSLVSEAAARGKGSALAETSLQRCLTASPRRQEGEAGSLSCFSWVLARPSACTLNREQTGGVKRSECSCRATASLGS